MNSNQWRNEVLRKKVGHAREKLNQASSSAGIVYASPNIARLYLRLSDEEKAPNKSMQLTATAAAD